jgi:hypothetical protein
MTAPALFLLLVPGIQIVKRIKGRRDANRNDRAHVTF